MISRAAVEHGREQSLGWPLGGVAARAAGGQDARTRHGEVNLPVSHMLSMFIILESRYSPTELSDFLTDAEIAGERKKELCKKL